jgi:V-type H+-transporting ATPase subunit a
MTFALCLQVPNHIKFKRPIEIYANFIPQMIFLQSIFGYLVLCILYKWSIDWEKSSTAPPSLLNMLINMFLSPGTVDPNTQLYPGQGFVQVVLILAAGVCVPWLLIMKPYHEWREMHKIQSQGYVGLSMETARESTDEHLEGEEEGNGRAINEANGASGSHGDEEGEGSHHDFSEVVIHQIIHTIEFCLGCISHTASYLRLWALSLAHAQLSEVLWSMTIEGFLSPSGLFGWIGLLLAGAMWFGLTVGILCLMEVGCRFLLFLFLCSAGMICG